jgi:DNA-binding NarL/FixJ family response regulator
MATEQKRYRIMVVDDHAIVRQGIMMLINREPDLMACCEAEQIEQAIAANRACRHDLLIADMSMEGFTGMELIRRMQFVFPDLPILVLSMHDELLYAEPALRAGAKGYLMKQAATDSLLVAIRQVLAGDLYVSAELRRKMVRQAVHGGGGESQVGKLSSSELEVLHLIGLGLGTSEIADKLSRSIKTVEAHKANIKKKLALESAAQLARFAANFVSSAKE